MGAIHSPENAENMATVTQTQTRLDPASFGKMRLKTHDSLYTIDDLIRSHASEPEDFTLIGSPVEGLVDFKEHSARDVDKFADAAAARLQELGLKSVVSLEASDLSTCTDGLVGPSLG